MDDSRPRHIRDIAHLYLSARRREGRVSVETVVVTGSHRECFPGFHVANLAAAFSQRKADVLVYEYSGLLPNASYYFGHPAGTYFGMRDRALRMYLPALNGIFVSFGPGDDAPPFSRCPQRIELVHVPPMSNPTEDAARFRMVANRRGARPWVVVIEEDGGAGAEQRLQRLGEVAGIDRVLILGVGGPPSERNGPAAVGEVRRWRRVLADRVSSVFREPDAYLARAYGSACERMMGRFAASRRPVQNAAATGLYPSRSAGG